MPLDANDPQHFAKDVDQYLRAAYAVAHRTDGYRGGTVATQALVAIVTTFLTDIIGAWPTPSAVARIRNNIPRFAALPDVPPTLAPVIELPRRAAAHTCHDCGEEFDSRADHLNHAADVHGHHIPRSEPLPGWYCERRDHDCNGECSSPCPMDDEDPRAWQG